ncbi:MAG: NADH-quinone oxidoreductase subunit F [Deltaproteobacteria bacterium]|nr:MAG: NADH-quinone oxidoreductase subunit F [Deltaproteobacteria bacterium]HEX16750.1 NADH-quinone oxidoreductase subunit F [Deltaproteobacteria bacterium]
MGDWEEIQSRALERWEALEQAPIHIRVGTPTCGRAAGALDTLRFFRERLAKEGIEAEITEVGCMGLCFAEPLVIISKPDAGFPPICYKNVGYDEVQKLVSDYLIGDDPCLELALGTVEVGEDGAPFIPEMERFEVERRLVLRNCGWIDPENIDHYIARGGYSSLRRVLLEWTPEEVIDEVGRAGLRGRGGAGFQTSRKWASCRRQEAEPKYLICNADEGDPGAFMDRVVLESDPHSVIEGMVIAAYAIGASKGFVYTRMEYPLVVERLRKALEQAREYGLLGEDIFGSGFSFDIEVVEGAGAFVCGEETAMIASIEGRRGMPRHRPPYPVEYGLWGKPTVVNNVKTLALVTRIMEMGAEEFRSIGTDSSPGTAVFALAGRVEQIGLVEVPMGTTLRQVVFEVGGGIPEGREFKAVQIGGPAGGCVGKEALDLPVDFDAFKAAGAIMGSGGMIVLDSSNCMVETARFFLDFLAREDCGKCTMGRLGIKQLLLILEDIVHGRGREEDLELLEELAKDLQKACLCNLGRTAANPILTTLRYFRSEYEAHIKEGRCPALVCKDLIAYWIVPERCEKGCDHCVLTCPTEAIVSDERTRTKRIVQDKCVKCGTCLEVCPPEYNAVIKVSPPSKIKELEEKIGG